MKNREICIYRADASSCNGCDIEIVAALSPRYRLHELGVRVVDKPEEAGVLLVTGGGNIKIGGDLRKVYEKLQPPRIVVAVGSCAISWEAFAGGYSIAGPADETMPVNLYLCGCPPRPPAIINALANTLGVKINEREDFWRPSPNFRGKHSLDLEACTACSACEQACPTRAIEITGKDGRQTVKYLLGKCSYCQTCERACPFDAVRLTEEYRLAFRDKEAAVVVADVELTKCIECGSFFVAPRQIEDAIDRIGGKAKEYAEYRENMRNAMKLCLNCRRKIVNVRGAKRLLAQLAAKTLESP